MVLAVLDRQRDYFQAPGPRKLELIGPCKQAERELRRLCEAVLAPPPVPTLFDPE